MFDKKFCRGCGCKVELGDTFIFGHPLTKKNGTEFVDGVYCYACADKRRVKGQEEAEKKKPVVEDRKDKFYS